MRTFQVIADGLIEKIKAISFEDAAEKCIKKLEERTNKFLPEYEVFVIDEEDNERHLVVTPKVQKIYFVDEIK